MSSSPAGLIVYTWFNLPLRENEYGYNFKEFDGMQKKNIVSILFAAFLILLGISLLLNYRFYRENKALKNSLPYLLDGKEII